MGILVKNVNFSASLSLTVLKICGFWAPDAMIRERKLAYNCYAFVSFMSILGLYLIIQAVDFFMVWGNLPLMTETGFVLFTIVAESLKTASMVLYRRTVGGIIRDADQLLGDTVGRAREIVKSCNRETRRHHVFYLVVTTVTVAGWMGSGEKNQLPLRAWYPYDSSKSPAYELSYIHQVGALSVAAYLNVSLDMLISTLIAQCHCRLQLVSLGLETLCEDLVPNEKGLLTPKQEATAWARLRVLVQQHEAVLRAATQLQSCFSAPIFVQFSVSSVMLCVTAFQLAAIGGNIIRLISMITHFVNMTFELFLYCYQGDQLSEESIDLAEAAYACPWYACSIELRRALLIVMVRTRRAARLTAGGFTTLSLASFMAIVKTSYSLFTVLQQSEERKN